MNSLRKSFRHLAAAVVATGATLLPSARADEVLDIGILPAGGSVVVSYEVAIASPLPATVTQISHQATIAWSGGSAPSDDPETAAAGDATLTALALNYDFGDAPLTYGTTLAGSGARHFIPAGGATVFLGASKPDFETDGQATADATGDGADEDGVTLPAVFQTNSNATLTVSASGLGFLNAWIDWNRDGDFGDLGEQVCTDRPLGAGNNNVVVVVPASLSSGASIARFRFTSSAGTATAPTGVAPDGEVEDYAVTLSEGPAVGTVTAPNLGQAAAGTPTYDLTIEYTDALGIDISTIGTGDIVVTGPGAIGTLTVTGVTVSPSGNGSPRTATYTVDAPGGAWNDADNGTYTIALLDGAVASTSGLLTIGDAALATFTVSMDTTAPDTTITATPLPLTPNSSATFTFSGSDAGGSGLAGFETSFDGNPFVTATSPRTYAGLADGSHTFAVRARDNAGNVDATPASFTWTIDTTPPAAPVLTAPANGSAGNDSTPALSGTAEPASTVAVIIDGASAGTTPADGSGNWTFTTASALTDGSHTARATATDAAGNTGAASSTNTFIVDTAAPDTTITAQPPSTSGASVSFTFTGSDVVSGVAGFAASLDGGAFAAATSPLAFTGLADGSHTFAVRATDAAGNTDATPASYVWTVDATPPAAPVVGSPAAGALTNDPTPTVSGTAEAGSTVTVRIDGSDSGSTTADASGNWSYTVAVALSEGSHTAAARATDAVGNVGALSGANTFTVDSVAPAAPVLAAPANNSFTNDTTPTLSGTAEAASTVTVTIDGGLAGTATADGSGNWSFTPAAALSEAAHTATVTATDAAGNTSANSNTNSFTVDLTAPAAPIVTALGATSVTGFAEAGSTVTVTVDGSVVGTATADAAGVWRYTFATALVVGTSHTISATATDAAGNTGPASAAFTATIGNSGSLWIVTNTNDAGAGSLRFAVDQSLAGDTVVFAPALSGATITMTSGQLAIAKDLTIDGSSLALAVTISGNHSSRVFSLDDGAVTLSRLQIVDGAAAVGAGVWVDAGDTTISNCVISGNASLAGGGGVAFSSSGSAVIVNSTISGNAAISGGGVLASDGSVTIVSSTISGNAGGGGGGGGVYVASTGSARVLNSIVAGNTGASGGDILAAGSLVAYSSWYGTTVSFPPVTSAAVAPNVIDVDASSIAALADNGGGTQTMALAATAPAVNAGVPVFHNSTDGFYFLGNDSSYHKLSDLSVITPADPAADRLTTDQRGVLRTRAFVGAPDLGAYEFVPAPSTAADPSSVAFSADTGRSSSDRITNATVQTISGKLTAATLEGEFVELSVDGSTWLRATNTVGTDTFSLAGVSLQAGANQLAVRVGYDAGPGGLVHGLPQNAGYTLDLIAPLAPGVTAPADGSITINPRPTISGTAEANSLVAVLLDGTVLATPLADGSGNWTYTPTADLANGPHAVTARATDVAGNVGPDSAANHFTADLRPTITSAANGTGTYLAAFSYQIIASNTPTSFAATGLPAGLSVNASTGRIGGTPQEVGTFAVTLTASNVRGTSDPFSLSLNIQRAGVAFVLYDLTASYDGTPHPAGAATNPPGLPVQLFYDTNTTAPSAVGTYAVLAVVDTPLYSGLTTGTLTITRGAQTIGFAQPADTTYGAAPLTLSATASSGLPVTLTLDSGPATLSGNTLTLTGVGKVRVTASQAGDGNYLPAASVTREITVGKGTATVTLSGLTATYDGSAHAASATTAPAGLKVTTTYNGAATAPTAAGSYTVVSTVDDTLYTGSATGTLTIAPATATVALSGLTATYDGQPKSATVATTPANLAVAVTYAGAATAPKAAGSYAVEAKVTDANYTGSATGTLTIAPANATVTLSGLTATYDGQPKSVGVATTPANLPVTITYDGGAAAPVHAGRYAVAVQVTDPNHSGTATATLEIAAIAPSLTWTPAALTYGSALGAAQLNATAPVAGTFSYTPAAGTILHAGTHTLSVRFTPAQAGDYTATTATATVTVAKKTLTVQALDAKMAKGDSLPAFTLHYSGWVNGDGVAVLTKVPTVLVGAPAEPAPGTYPLTPYGAAAADYAFNYVVGTLTVVSPGAPEIGGQTDSSVGEAGGSASVSVDAAGEGLTYQWYRQGVAVPGATGPRLTFANFAAENTGLYDCVVSGPAGSTLSRPVVLGLLPKAGERTAGAVTTRTEWQDIRHPNGNVYDQFLLTGRAGTFTADAGQIARLSFLDENESIVQVEMSGAGAITVVLDPETVAGPMAPALYNQAGIQYMRGRATVTLAGADETTHFTIYSVGPLTNPGVTRADVPYFGWAEVAVAGVVSLDGKLGGIHQGNVLYTDKRGFTGVFAPSVRTLVGQPAVVHDIAAAETAVPYLRFGAGGTVQVKIAGGDLSQLNGDNLYVGGVASMLLGAGQSSAGEAAPAQPLRTRLFDSAGRDVTAELLTQP